MMRRILERYGLHAAAVLVLAAVAVPVGFGIAIKQRLQVPWADRYTVRAEFQTITGLNPGLGQLVTVAGVKVGTISGAEVRDGRAIVNLEIDPQELAAVYRDARAFLVPNTPLKDMQIHVFPGTRSKGELPENAIIPVARTAPPVDSDELLGALDADVRDYLELLISGTEQGVADRGEDLRKLLKAVGPTAHQAKRVTKALADRRVELERLVTNLAILGRATRDKDDEVGRIIEAADTTLAAMASQESALREATAKLPGTLQATREAFRDLTPFAREARPALDALLPVARRAPAALRAARPLVTEGAPLLKDKLRPLVKDLQPIARDLGPITTDLNAVTPYLTSAFQVLTYTVNELMYNPPGDNEGFGFWAAWFAHNAASFTSVEDAHGAGWRGIGIGSCAGIQVLVPVLQPLGDLLAGLLPVCEANGLLPPTTRKGK